MFTKIYSSPQSSGIMRRFLYLGEVFLKDLAFLLFLREMGWLLYLYGGQPVAHASISCPCMAVLTREKTWLESIWKIQKNMAF